MDSKVSVRGQTVIPNEIRKAMGITRNSILHWQIRDGVIMVYPIPRDPVRASLGILQGKGSLDEFLRERRQERAKEQEREGRR
jgi:AbrB family looped-hinge helix DNA binding protein